MATGSERRAPPEGGATLSVESFGWGAPDRLVLTGTFSGLPAEPPAGAVLTVLGDDGAHRLSAVEGDRIAAPVDGAAWTAAFAWQDAPVAFDRARLELGGRLAVDLPGPGEAADDGPLPVEDLQARAVAQERRETTELETAVDRLRREARLVEATEQLEEARASARQATEALRRLEADLAEERECRAADAERFREALAMMRGSAEEAVEAAAAARAQAEQRAKDEVAVLRERLAALEGAEVELESTRAELGETRAELERAHADLDAARGALDAAREGARALIDRLGDTTTPER